MNTKRNFLFALVASLTLGLAPFSPEPHLFGKLRWLFGGGEGMKLMDYWDLVMHGAPWVLMLYFGYQLFFSKSHREKIKAMTNAAQHPKAKFIDVREPNEFKSGHVEGAINFPLSRLSSDIQKIQKMEGPFILYCRSGMRSGQAKKILESNEIEEVYNAGTMANLNNLRNS